MLSQILCYYLESPQWQLSQRKLVDINHCNPFLHLAWQQHVVRHVAGYESVHRSERSSVDQVFIQHLAQLSEVEVEARGSVFAPSMEEQEAHLEQFEGLISQ